MCKTDQLLLKSNSTEFHRFVPSLLLSTTWCFFRSQNKRNSAATTPAGLSDANMKKRNLSQSQMIHNSMQQLWPTGSQRFPATPLDYLRRAGWERGSFLCPPSFGTRLSNWMAPQWRVMFQSAWHTCSPHWKKTRRKGSQKDQEQGRN